MAGSVNKAFLIGNLGQDPESQTTQSGDLVVTLSVATSETWRDKNTGERRERTEWHRVVIFNDRHAKFAADYLKKGAKVYLEGKIATRKWQDRSGLDRYTTEIVLDRYGGGLQSLEKVGGNRAPGADSPDDYGRTSSGSGTQAPSAPPDIDDEIPY